MRASILAFLLPLAWANPAPVYPGYTLLWSDAFDGAAGQAPDSKNWRTITKLHVNNEVQEYTTSSANLQLSGGSTLQIVPRKDPSTGRWTSARVESERAFAPAPGKRTLISAAVRYGAAPRSRKQGLWPAFWLLGEAVRHGTPWPRCGEIDIAETVNGEPRAHGTVHCGEGDVSRGFSGGPCGEPDGRGAAVGVEDYGWHVWSVEVDRTNGAGGWRGERIRWLKDGSVFFELGAEDIGVEGVWATLAHSPMFVVLNVAVGGDWPGLPNAATADGYENMMEVDYVAVYSS